MYKQSEAMRRGLARVVWIQVEEEELEFLYAPEINWMFPEPFPLHEGDQFLYWWQDQEVIWPGDAIFRRDVETIQRLWKIYSGRKEDDRLSRLEGLVQKILDHLGLGRGPESIEDEIERELAEVRAEREAS